MKCSTFLVFFCFILYAKALKLDSAKSDLFPSKEICGRKSCDAFPWLVFIPLESRIYNPDANLRCAGALISKRYVLTRKSCLQFVLSKIHIGQYNTSTDVTCENKPVLKIDIEDKKVDDASEIVLLRLAQDVEFGNDINPICLPFDGYKRAETGQEVFSSGWGLKSPQVAAQRTDVMKNVKQTLITNEDCQKIGIIPDASDAKVMCLKRKSESVDYACYGDGGSPIMSQNKEQWVAEGILTSAVEGIETACAVEKPARAARITDEVLEWIVNNMHA